MVEAKAIPVSKTALLQRLRRHLRERGQTLKSVRGRLYVIEAGHVIATHADALAWAEAEGLLKSFEVATE